MAQCKALLADAIRAAEEREAAHEAAALDRERALSERAEAAEAAAEAAAAEAKAARREGDARAEEAASRRRDAGTDPVVELQLVEQGLATKVEALLHQLRVAEARGARAQARYDKLREWCEGTGFEVALDDDDDEGDDGDAGAGNGHDEGEGLEGQAGRAAGALVCALAGAAAGAAVGAPRDFVSHRRQSKQRLIATHAKAEPAVPAEGAALAGVATPASVDDAAGRGLSALQAAVDAIRAGTTAHTRGAVRDRLWQVRATTGRNLCIE